MFIDFNYILIVLIPGVLIGMWAQAKVKAAYARASKIGSRRGMTGAEVAAAILRASDVSDVRIEPTGGFLSDHYHPTHKALRLSERVYKGASLASAGIAAHEVGHALQHARGYLPLAIRSALVPVCQIGQWIGQTAMLLGFVLMMFAGGPAGKTILFWAILGYGAVFLFTLVTLPVEFNASSRAIRVLAENGILYEDELPEARRVLNAAALTYVASAVQVLLVLLYLIMLYNRR